MIYTYRDVDDGTILCCLVKLTRLCAAVRRSSRSAAIWMVPRDSSKKALSISVRLSGESISGSDERSSDPTRNWPTRLSRLIPRWCRSGEDILYPRRTLDNIKGSHPYREINCLAQFRAYQRCYSIHEISSKYTAV